MDKKFNIHTLVGHLGLHNDEFVAGKMLRERGQKFWGKKIRTAKWRFLDDPSKHDPQQLIAQGELPIGICGFPYDEHNLPNAREKFICSARIVYERLGIADDYTLDDATRATYQSMTRYAIYADCQTGVDWQALPNLFKRRWNRYYAFQGTEKQKQRQLEDLIWRCERDVDDFFDDTLVFWQALFAIKNNLEKQELRIEGKPVWISVLRRDNPAVLNPKVKDALVSRRWEYVTKQARPDFIFKRTPNGQFQMFTTNADDWDLSDVVVALRSKEMERRGIDHKLTGEELQGESCESCHWIHYMRGSQTIQNGGLNFPGVEGSVLSDEEILQIFASKAKVQRVVVPRRHLEADQIEVKGPVEAAPVNASSAPTVTLAIPDMAGTAPVAD